MEAADKIKERRSKYIKKAKQIIAKEKAAKNKKKIAEKESNKQELISISPKRVSKILKQKRKTGSKWELVDD